MPSVTLTREGPVFILRMQAGENRFNGAFVAELHAALDEVERSSGPAALVTVGEEKFFSNGFDIAWMGEAGSEATTAMLNESIRILGRYLAFPMATVAAVNGHAFGVGAMLAIVHDFTFMRADRGFWCLPELDLGIVPLPGLMAVVNHRVPQEALRATLLTGARLGAEEAVRRRILDEAVPLDALLPKAVEKAASLADKDRETMGGLKRAMNAAALAVIEGK